MAAKMPPGGTVGGKDWRHGGKAGGIFATGGKAWWHGGMAAWRHSGGTVGGKAKMLAAELAARYASGGTAAVLEFASSVEFSSVSQFILLKIALFRTFRGFSCLGARSAHPVIRNYGPAPRAPGGVGGGGPDGKSFHFNHGSHFSEFGGDVRPPPFTPTINQ